MAVLISFLFFVVLCFFVFFLPGKWVLKKIGYKSQNVVTGISISLGVGIALFLISNYVLAWMQIPYIYYLFVLSFIFLELPSTIYSMKGYFPWRFIFSPESMILIAGSVTLFALTASSGLEKDGALTFYGVNALDGIYHSALIGNLVFQFPPSYPGLSHTLLQGYHFLYDFMLSRFSLFFGLTIFDLYFRFFSLFTAFFYGICGLALSYKLGMKRIARIIFLFLLFFAQGGEFFIFHWFHGADLLYNSGIVQPAGNIVDPSVLFSMSFVFLLYITLFANKKKTYSILPILFLGILPGIKIYTAILTYCAVLVLVVVQLLRKNISLLLVLVPAGLLSLTIYAPFNLGAGSLLFNPFLFFRHFMESDRVLAPLQWALKLQVYEMHRNIPRIIYLYIIAVLFYFIPPLGIRLVASLQIKKIFSQSFYTYEHIFWTVFICVGLLLPTFFIQSVSVFNTVQFFWLVWIALLIPTAFSLSSLLGKGERWKVVVLFCLVIISSFPIVRIFIGVYQTNIFSVSQTQLSIARTIQALPKNNDVLVVDRVVQDGVGKDAYAIPLFAATSHRPMFYEPEAADFSKSQVTEKMRQHLVDEISYRLVSCPPDVASKVHSLLKEAHVQYILLLTQSPCVGQIPFFDKTAVQGNYTLLKLHNL